ncbi:MAG: glutamate 5-kinase [Lewinella sp.]|nr:glutamate 5-kinase [Lewinella sp.]
MERNYHRIVVKVGTNVLTRPDGRLDVTNISHLVDQLAVLKAGGTKVVLISSGAVGAGRELLPSADQMDTVVRRQMLSSIGQVRLMELYRQLFAGHGLLCAQVLATKEDFRDRRHYLNMRNCFDALLHDQIIPVVNENDVISVTELMFTDNDELAGLVTAMIDAEALIILSSVDGLFTGAPDDPAAELITRVAADDEAVAQHIAPVKSSFGRGGMSTKLRMAQQTARLGADVFLANGRRPGILAGILAGTAPCTHVPRAAPVSNVKKWIAHHQKPRGVAHINAGAKAAICDPERVTSLLPVGITRLEGEFEKGDLLLIIGPTGEPIGHGLAQYGAEKARNWLGQQDKKALVHYDYLVVMGV